MVKTSVTDIIDHQNNPSVTTEDWYDNLTLNCWQVELAPYARMMLPSVWSSLFSVNKQAFGTLVSLFILIFFSPSNKRNDSKAGGAFMMNIANTTQPAAADLLLDLWRPHELQYACANWPPSWTAAYGNSTKTNFMNTCWDR